MGENSVEDVWKEVLESFTNKCFLEQVDVVTSFTFQHQAEQFEEMDTGSCQKGKCRA